MDKPCCIYRIDDVAPGMNWGNFLKYMDLFHRYNVVPLIGVVPENRDANLTVGREAACFWELIRYLKEHGTIEIAQHGYRHIYTTNKIQPFYRLCGFIPQSEFYGISYEKQYEMIKAGRDILEEQGIYSDIWMAPGHSYDKNTIRALKDLGFRAVTDSLALFNVKRQCLTFVPQQSWGPGKSRMGIKTICLHLNNADDKLYIEIEKHLKGDRNIIPFSKALSSRNPPWACILNIVYKPAFFLKVLLNEMRTLKNNYLT